MNGFEIGEFKQALIRKLIGDPEMARLLDPSGYAEYPDDLIYQNIFPYNRVPDTEQEVKTYITVMANVASVPARNDITRKVALVIRIYSHADLMQVEGSGSDRIDLLGARVDTLINESNDFGIGYVILESSTEHVLDSRHFYRELVFKTDALNCKRDGVKQWS